MRRLADALYDITLTLWVGGLWAIGFLVAPTLFAVLASDRQLAGLLAGKLFALIGWVGLGCASYLLLHTVLRMGTIAWRRWTFWLLLADAAAHRRSISSAFNRCSRRSRPTPCRDRRWRACCSQRFAIWHGVSGVVYVLQSLLGVLLIGFRRAAR
jgi:hypothetical protein